MGLEGETEAGSSSRRMYSGFSIVVAILDEKKIVACHLDHMM